MRTADVRTLVLEALRDVAPEVDVDTVQGDVPLRDQYDIDSMDFLNFVIGVNERTGVEIPERDYGALTTLDGFVAYLAEHASTAG
jgi:acyl carrier protein